MVKILVLIGLFSLVSAGMAQEMTISECRTVLSNCPDCVRVAIYLSGLLAKTGDATNAETILQKVIKLDRTSGLAYYNLGTLKLNSGNYEEAIDCFIKATIFETNNVQSYINLGNIYNLRNDLNLASFYYRKAQLSENNDPDLLNNLGVLSIKQKTYPEALDYLSRAFALKPDDDTRLNLAVVWHFLGKTEKIQELYPAVNPADRNYQTIMELLGNH